MKKIYVETSVIGFWYATDAPEKMSITRKFFKLAQKEYQLFISDLVLKEIERFENKKRKLFEKVLKKFKFDELKTNEEAIKLAKEYVKAGIVPEKYFNDSLHIAIAVVNKIDVMVSWNLSHIVKLKTKMKVNEINKNLNYPEIIIVTPLEVIL
jgi:rRNA-processing protein FCF1